MTLHHNADRMLARGWAETDRHTSDLDPRNGWVTYERTDVLFGRGTYHAKVRHDGVGWVASYYSDRTNMEADYRALQAEGRDASDAELVIGAVFAAGFNRAISAVEVAR